MALKAAVFGIFDFQPWNTILTCSHRYQYLNLAYFLSKCKYPERYAGQQSTAGPSLCCEQEWSWW